MQPQGIKLAPVGSADSELDPSSPFSSPHAHGALGVYNVMSHKVCSALVKRRKLVTSENILPVS